MALSHAHTHTLLPPAISLTILAPSNQYTTYKNLLSAVLRWHCVCRTAARWSDLFYSIFVDVSLFYISLALLCSPLFYSVVFAVERGSGWPFELILLYRWLSLKVKLMHNPLATHIDKIAPVSDANTTIVVVVVFVVFVVPTRGIFTANLHKIFK